MVKLGRPGIIYGYWGLLGLDWVKKGGANFFGMHNTGAESYDAPVGPT